MAGYGDDNGLETWAEANGYSLPSTADATVLRQRGSAYIDGLYGSMFSGQPTGGYAQERAWPRTGAKAGTSSIPSDVIPVAVINASYSAALYEASNPGALVAAVTPGARVKREKVDKIEVEYVTGSDATVDATPVLIEVEGLLAPFLIPVVDQPLAIFAIG